MIRHASRSQGLTLIELMIGLSISSVATVAIVTAWSHANALHRDALQIQTVEASAARALTLIRDAVAQSGFVIASSQQGGAGEPGSPVCSAQWLTQLQPFVAGHNERYAWPCPPNRGIRAAGSDSLLIRYASALPVPARQSGETYLLVDPSSPVELITGSQGTAPRPAPLQTVHEFHAQAFYIGQSTDGTQPALRMKHLGQRRGRPRVVDDEVQSGIADLQFEFGIASTAPPDPAASVITPRFVSADELPDDVQIVAVRVWLLAAGTQAIAGGTGSVIPAYADRPAQQLDDARIRRLVTATIELPYATRL